MSDDEIGLKLNLKNRRETVAGLKDVEKGIDGVAAANRRARRGAQDAASGLSSLRDAVGSGLSSAARMGIRSLTAVTAATTALGTVAVVTGIKTAASFEQSEIAFGVLLKSQTRAKQMMSDLRSFAEDSPFELGGVNRAAQRLLAMGFAADQIMPTMKTLGNASASGITGLEEGLSRLSYALGQMRAAGRVQGDELRQFEEMGIGVRSALAKGFKIPEDQFMDAVKAGRLSADKAIPIILAEIDRNMGGMMDAQSKSWSGMWSRFKETATNNLGDIARAGMDPFRPAFVSLGNWTDKQGKKVTKIAQEWRLKFDELRIAGIGSLDAAAMALDSVLGGGGRAVAALDTARRVWTELKPVLKDIGTIVTESIIPALKDVAPIATPFLGAISKMIKLLADHPDAARLFFEGMVVAIVTFKVAEKVYAVEKAFTGLSGATRAAGGSMAFFNAMIYANPIVFIVAVSIAAMAALWALSRKVNDGASAFEHLWAATSPFAFLLVTIKNHFDGIRNAVQGVIDTIKDLLKQIGDLTQKLPGGEGTLGKILGGVGRISMPGLPLPLISKALPGLASGGTTTTSGAVLVGERGPEVLSLPAGARVQPLDNSEGPPTFGDINHIYVSGTDVLHAERTADIILSKIEDRKARQ